MTKEKALEILKGEFGNTPMKIYAREALNAAIAALEKYQVLDNENEIIKLLDTIEKAINYQTPFTMGVLPNFHNWENIKEEYYKIKQNKGEIKCQI